MTVTLPSAADEADIQLYSEGSCHVFAVALHRRLGMSIMVVTDPESPYWEDEADADNFIPSVTHVYAVDADGVAWDVLGARPMRDACADVRERYPDVGSTDDDYFPHEGGLSTYVDGMGEDDLHVDRPLHSFTDADVEEAWECARRILCDVPGFPSSPPSPGL